MMHRLTCSRCLQGLTVIGLISALTLVGCSPAPSGSDESSNESTISSITSTTTSLSQDGLDAEAERVYRAYFELEQDVLADGGAEELPPEMNEYIMGLYARDSQVLYQAISESGMRTVPGKRAEIMVIQPDPDDRYEDSLATLDLCFDTRDAPFMHKNGEVGQGDITYHTIYLKNDQDQKLKIFESTSETVDQCPIT